MIIDLRSDTLTKPTAAMLASMQSAQVGDDVFGEDPTINALQEKAAAMFGMEAALFCPSGTMTNQIAIRLHTQPQSEVICDKLSHIYLYEGGGIAYNSMSSVRLLEGEKGKITASMVLDNINNVDDIHLPLTSLVSLENTVNKGGGAIYTVEEIKPIAQVCKEKGLKLHLDGARLFNALAESGDKASDYGQLFDSISICLSKGLGAPVGSLLLGTKEDIKRAKRIRKVLGGGMRQAGFLAAAGIYALDYHIDRLKEDHQRAKTMAKELSKLAKIKTVLDAPTNIVIIELQHDLSIPEYLQKLKKEGLLAVAFGKHQIRFVTHLDFDDKQLEASIKIFQKVFA